MEYTIFILLLPVLMFLFLGLAGHKLKPNVAGIFGTISLGIVTALSYITAFQFFTAPRVNGVFATLIPAMAAASQDAARTSVPQFSGDQPNAPMQMTLLSAASYCFATAR